MMDTLIAGTATDNGTDGADWHLKFNRALPDYYISESIALSKGWIKKLGNLNEVAPGTMFTGGIYKNKDCQLPQIPGRVWFEADLNYTGGFRNSDRILFSNDGLIFVTYDHYETFIEIL